MAEYARMRTMKQVDVSYDKKKAHFGGTQFPLRDLEYTERVGCQIGVDRQHEEDDQQSGGNALTHVTGKREPENQKHRAESVYDMVHIKPIARTLAIPVSRQCSVQAVAKPVEKYAEIHKVQHQRILFARRVADTGQEHSYKAEDRQMVGVYPDGHAAREASKRRSFQRSQHTRLLSLSILETIAFH